MVLSAMVVSPSRLVELVFPCRHDKLQQLADALAGSTFRAGVKAQFTPWPDVIEQRLARALAQAERPDQVEAHIHKALWRQRTGGAQAVDDELYPRFIEITDLLGGEIDAFHQAAG